MSEFINSEARISNVLVDLYFVSDYTLKAVDFYAFRNRYFRAVDSNYFRADNGM